MTIPENSPHLTLAELAASGSNGPLSAAATAHLDACAACRARSRDAVADGVRFLLTRCQPPPGLMDSVFEVIDAQQAPAHDRRPARGGPARWPAIRWHHRAKRVVLATAVAAVLLAGAGAGLATTLSPAAQPGGAEGGGGAITHAGLTLTECPRLRLDVLGRRLQQVSGTSLLLAGPLTVTTSPGTEILRQVTGTAADVTDGATVLVIGTAKGTAITSMLVAVMPGAGSATQSGAGATPGLAYGTVTDARDTGFTVVEGDGTRIPVTMSASSSVITAVPSSLGELRAGQMTSVVVSQGPDGTLAAVTVEQGSLSAAALNALRESLLKPRVGAPGQPGPGRSYPVGGSLPGSLPNVVTPSGYGGASVLPYLLGGSTRPFASLGCDPSAITSVNLIALALGG